MRKKFVSLLALCALVLGSTVAGQAQAAPAVRAAFDPASPPPRYSPAVERARMGAGVMAPKGKIVGGKGFNPNAGLLAGPYYFYGLARQSLTAGQSATTYGANLHQENAYLDTANDAHTLAEIAVQSHNGQQIVEIGITHDTAVCAGGTSPCLFTGSWKNGVFLGYNTGFVDYAPEPIDVGDTLPTGTPKRFYFAYSSAVWWAAYDSKWIGYFPGTIWTNAPNSVTFDKGGLFQGFYEVATLASGDNTPCTDMGNGRDGATDGLAARIGTNAIGGTLPGPIANNFTGSTLPVVAPYTFNQVSAQTTRAGGPGYNAAGTGVGTTGAC
jgi:hypothetical protein